jgi:hypothetical protein
MATRYAVANGNWSNTATWDGGTLPTSADDVHANNRTVTIDQDVTVLSLRTTAGGAAVAGGGFSIPNGSSYNVTATNGFIAGSSAVLTITGTGTRIITGNVTGSATTATVNTIYVTHSSGNIPNVTINGNLLGGSQSSSVALYIWGGYVTVNGSVTGGTASTNAHGINIFNSDNQPTQLTVNTGPITGGSSSSGSCTGINVGYSPTGSALTNSFININCNLVGGTVGNNNHAYNSSSTIPLTVVGNITGGTTSSGINSTTVTIAGSSVSITGTCTAGLVTAVQVSAFSVTILGDIVGGTGTNTGGLLYGGIGTCTVTGTIYGSTSNINGRGIYAGFNTPGHLIVNGDVYARNGIGISNTGNGQITVNGNIYGGTATNAHGMNPSATNLITVNGNVFGGSGGGACGISTSSTPTIIVNGNVTGGTNNTAIGVRQGSNGIVTINGTVTAGTGFNAQGVANISTGTIIAKRAKGNDYGAGSVGIQQAYALTSEAQGSVTYLEEIEMGSRGAFPLFNHVLFINKNTNSATFYTSGLLSVKTLVDPNASGLMPSGTNVRSGIVYSAGNLSGTMIVPNQNSVAYGVPVDSGVGTAILRPQDVWDYMRINITGSGTIGERLKNSATISSVGDQIAAF